MVTKLHDGRGQITLKGHEVTADWEQLAKKAAERQGQSFAAFVVGVTTDAAQAMLKGQPAVPAALPMRIEDVADSLTARMEAMQAAMDARLAVMERASRRGSWRR